MTDQFDYTATLDQRLAKMRETARLAAAFYKGLIDEGISSSDAIGITAIYSTTINSQQEEDDA